MGKVPIFEGGVFDPVRKWVLLETLRWTHPESFCLDLALAQLQNNLAAIFHRILIDDIYGQSEYRRVSEPSRLSTLGHAGPPYFKSVVTRYFCRVTTFPLPP